MYQYLLQKNAKLKHLSVLLIVICKTSITACCHWGEKKKGASRLLGYENEVHFGKRRRLLPLVTFHPRPAPPSFVARYRRQLPIYLGCFSSEQRKWRDYWLNCEQRPIFTGATFRKSESVLPRGSAEPELAQSCTVSPRDQQGQLRRARSCFYSKVEINHLFTRSDDKNRAEMESEATWPAKPAPKCRATR